MKSEIALRYQRCFRQGATTARPPLPMEAFARFGWCAWHIAPTTIGAGDLDIKRSDQGAGASDTMPEGVIPLGAR